MTAAANYCRRIKADYRKKEKVMKKKSVLLLSTLLALSVGVAGAAACSGEHKHDLRDVPFKDATCTHQGRVAHQECADCHKYFIDGKEVGESELVIPKDPAKHVLENVEYRAATCVDEGVLAHGVCQECGNYFVDGEYVNSSSVVLEVDPAAHKIEHMEEVAATCGADGMLEHDECVYCRKIYKDGEETDAAEYVIPKGGEHTFESGAIECSVCDAYKLIYEGEYYVIDSYNQKQFVTGAKGADYGATPAADKNAAIKDHIDNPMTFGTQRNNGITAANADGKEWVLTNSTSGDVSSFTRFVAAKPGETAGYVGKFILTFDVTANVNTPFSRFGAKVVSNSAGTLAGADESKLIGSHADADPRIIEFKAGTVYRFAYVMETTASDQIIQIFTCFAGESSVSISNLHLEFIDQGATGVVTSKMLYFGEPEGIKITADECAHENAYDVAGTATCTAEGILAHRHCPQCGQNVIDGEVVETVTGKLPHTIGEWQSDANNHWKECSVCNTHFDEEAHTPGPEATETTPQVCTVCDYVLAKPTIHQHEMQYVAAKAETCTEDGNIEYWHCTDPDCGKYFSDENGDNEIEASSIVISAHHTLTEYEAGDSTCFRHGTDVAYSACTVCGKFFVGGTEIAGSELFTKPLTEHNIVDGACTNAGCTAKQEASEIVVPDACFGTQGATINPALVANPGKWAAQTKDANKASVENGVLKIEIASNNTDKNKTAFVRVIPSQNGTDAFVGTYIWTFDFKVTAGLGSAASAEDVNIYVGFFIQSTTESGNLGTIADVSTKFTIGQTYRFSVLAETWNANQFAQFNIRNVAGSGAKIEISNASYVFYPKTANTGANALISREFAQPVEAAADTVATTLGAVIIEDKRYLAA